MLSAGDCDKIIHGAAHNVFILRRYGADKIEQNGCPLRDSKNKRLM
jgi:hypothetical protein